MTFATDGVLPKDINGVPASGGYIPNVGTVPIQLGTVATDSNNQAYAYQIVQQIAPQAVSGTLQNAANATGNGTSLSLLGNSAVIFTVTMTGFTGTVNFQGSEDGTNYDPITVVQLGTSVLGTSVTGSTTTATHLYEGSCAGLQSVLCPITRSAGTVTITAHAVPTTYTARALNLAQVGGVNVSSFGTIYVQSAKSNYALVAGTGTTPVTIKNSAGYLRSFMVTTTASAALTFYDNASAASGTALYVTASNIAAGTYVTVDMPFANGLTVSQASGTMAATIAYI